MAPEPTAGKERAKSDRTTVGLSPAAIKHTDALIERGKRKTREALGYAVTQTRSQVVEAVLAEAATRREGESS